MEFLNKLEDKVFGWFRGAPNLPNEARKSLAENAWWIVIIGSILMTFSILKGLDFLENQATLQGSTASSYYISTTVSDWAVFATTISVVFLVAQVILMLFAVKPLKEMQKKGWVLLFSSWLLSGVALVANALLTLGIVSFIITVLFGAVWLAISGYFLFEIHGQFAHVERSKGVKKAE
jgi:uncharacterized membrane protein YhaH (DUF805 family)